MELTFDQPFVLALLPLSLVLVISVWRVSRAYLTPGRRLGVLALRIGAITCLIVALSGANLRLNGDTLAVMVLLDRSESISPAQRQQEEDWVAQALAHKRPQDSLGVIGFGGEASVERPLSSDYTQPVYSDDSTLQPSRTDIARAIELAIGILPPDACVESF